MYDFAALSAQDNQIGIKMHENMLIIIKSFTNKKGPSFVVNTLATAYSILFIHIHH